MEYFTKWFNETQSILLQGYTKSQIDSFPYWQDSFCYEMTPEVAAQDFEKWLCE